MDFSRSDQHQMPVGKSNIVSYKDTTSVIQPTNFGTPDLVSNTNPILSTILRPIGGSYFHALTAPLPSNAISMLINSQSILASVTNMDPCYTSRIVKDSDLMKQKPVKNNSNFKHLEKMVEVGKPIQKLYYPAISCEKKTSVVPIAAPVVPACDQTERDLLDSNALVSANITPTKAGEENPDTRLFVCPLRKCQERFRASYSLKRHMNKHIGVRPYICPYEECERRFAESSTLRRHIRTHTGEKPYQCNYRKCGKRFAELTTIRRHVLTHTGAKPYNCPMESCGKSFSRGSILRKHMISKHNLEKNDPLIRAATMRRWGHLKDSKNIKALKNTQHREVISKLEKSFAHNQGSLFPLISREEDPEAQRLTRFVCRNIWQSEQESAKSLAEQMSVRAQQLAKLTQMKRKAQGPEFEFGAPQFYSLERMSQDILAKPP